MPYNYGNGTAYPYQYSGQQYSTAAPNYQSQAQPTNFENTFAWVYGDAGAEAFPVAPGKTVLLMHYSEPILYVKSTDMNGRPIPMEVYELVRRNNGGYSQYSQAPQITQQPQVNMNEYVKKSELESQVNDIMNRNAMSQRSMNNGSMMQGQMPPNNSQNWTQPQEVYDGKPTV